MTIIMIAMICVGCAAVIAGLVSVGVQGVRLGRAARTVGLSSIGQIQAVVRRAEQLGTRLETIAHEQQELAERLENLSATTRKFSYLAESLDEATGHLSNIKS
jgi:predicted ArsR family transcriptional regulator